MVVGGGPTGLLASILLSVHKIPHVLVEQRPGTLQAPAAHVVNTRTMEIYRQAGIDVAELCALNTHPHAHLVSWKSRLESDPIGVFDASGNRDALIAAGQVSREHTTNISQHLLEAYLKRHAEQSEFADIRFGVEWLGFEDPDRQTSRVRCSDGSEQIIAYQYMFAADGAGSPVARTLGIRKVGPDAIATFLNLTCEVDLAEAAGEEEALLYWLLNPEVQGTIIVHDPHKLAVYMRPLAVPYESAEDYDEDRCDRLLKEVFGEAPYKIKHKGIWKMTAQVAERFREGPVFLMGDSIHRFPPTGGLGLNTGVGDVHNLVWKVAAALHGSLDAHRTEELLASYELERRPVAQRNCDVSKRNNEKMIEVIQALGLDPSKADLLAKIMNSGVVKVLPEGLQATIYTLLTRPVRRLLNAAEQTDQEGDAIRARVAEAIANQEEHFSSLGLDLGYVYREGAGVSEDAAATVGSEVSSYTETFAPGARLPHRQLAAGDSLHDRLDYLGFTLIRRGTENTAEVESFGLPLKEVGLGQDEPGLGGQNWLLVRPDGHVMAAG